ncbi:hypothetical protein CsSME_00042356 [Camellia sinensis var. sinensis]
MGWLALVDGGDCGSGKGEGRRQWLLEWMGERGGIGSNRRWCGLRVEWSAMGIVADGGGKGRGGRGARGRGRETVGSAPVQAISQNMRFEEAKAPSDASETQHRGKADASET